MISDNTTRNWRPKPRRRSEFYARIDLTGLRGVFLVGFVLLCMFPGPTHTGYNRFPADLPTLANVSPHPNALRDNALQIGIRRQGDIFVFGNRNRNSIERVAPADLPNNLRSLLLPGVERRVYVTADSRSKYGAVAAALNGIRDAGISDVTLFSNDRSGERN